MVHARMIRPPVAGAVPVKVDESSIKDIPGARVVRENDFLAVVADKEWDAIKARQTAQGRMVGRQAAVPDARRRSTTTSARRRCASARTSKPVGNVDEAFKTAARVIEAEYEWPFQSHACMGPACARGRDQGRPRHLLDRLAEAALRARRRRRHARHAGRQGATASGWSAPAPTAATTPTTARWTPPCSPRRSAGRCALQYMREQGTGWDPKGPASIHRARAAIDASGKVIAYEFLSKGFSRFDVHDQRQQAGRTRSPAISAACR